MRVNLFVAAVVGVVCLTQQVSAQTEVPVPTPAPWLTIIAEGGGPTTCKNFKRNDDGSWSNIRFIQIKVTEENKFAVGGVVLRPGTYNNHQSLKFPPGVFMNGVDIVGQLEAACLK